MKDYYIHGGHLYHWKRSGFLQILYFPFEINIFLPPLSKIKPLSLYIEWHTSVPAVGVRVRPPPFFLSVSLSLTRLLQILGLKSLQISTEREKWEGCVRWEVGFRKVDVPGNGEIIWRGGGHNIRFYERREGNLCKVACLVSSCNWRKGSLSPRVSLSLSSMLYIHTTERTQTHTHTNAQTTAYTHTRIHSDSCHSVVWVWHQEGREREREKDSQSMREGGGYFGERLRSRHTHRHLTCSAVKLKFGRYAFLNLEIMFCIAFPIWKRNLVKFQQIHLNK